MFDRRQSAANTAGSTRIHLRTQLRPHANADGIDAIERSAIADLWADRFLCSVHHSACIVARAPACPLGLEDARMQRAFPCHAAARIAGASGSMSASTIQPSKSASLAQVSVVLWHRGCTSPGGCSEHWDLFTGICSL